MKSMVVFFALCAVAYGSYVPLAAYQVAQPPHHPAVVLDPHGRPLDTAEVIAARNLHLQAKHLEHAPAVHAVAPAVYAATAVHAYAPALYAAAPSISYHGHHAHLLKKRSLGLGHYAYAAAPTVYVGSSAVSHQSRVDVVNTPTVHHVAAPVVAHAQVVAHAVHAPVVAHIAPAAVSHQSRVDVRTSPAVVAHAIAPVAVHSAPLVHSAPHYAHSSLW